MSHESLLQIIEDRTATRLRDARLERVQRQLDQLLLGHRPAELAHMLHEQALTSPMWQKLVAEMTVGESYFYRNQAQFDALRLHILPQLIEQRRALGSRYLRLWSAGCAAGEEPYSLAMLLRELLPDWRDWSIFILATDINQVFLEQAQNGLYRASAFRSETPPDLVDRWFSRQGERYLLDESIRQMVTFRWLNLRDSSYPNPSNFTIQHDLILCRNVTIYFSQQDTQAVVNRLHGALQEGGWLLVGHAEPQLHVYDAFQMEQVAGTILYRKSATPQAQPITAPPSAPPLQWPDWMLQAAASEATSPPPVRPGHQEQAETLAQARRLIDREDWPQALRLLDSFENFDPYNPLVHFVRALILAHASRLKAIDALQQAIYCEPSFALAHYWQGELWHREGRLEQAQACWRRALKALQGLEDEALLLGDAEMTTDMLRHVLRYRLER